MGLALVHFQKYWLLNIHLIIDNLKDDTIDILASLDYETLYFAYFEIW